MSCAPARSQERGQLRSERVDSIPRFGVGTGGCLLPTTVLNYQITPHGPSTHLDSLQRPQTHPRSPWSNRPAGKSGNDPLSAFSGARRHGVGSGALAGNPFAEHSCSHRPKVTTGAVPRSCGMRRRWMDGSSRTSPAWTVRMAPGIARAPASFVRDPLAPASRALRIDSSSA